jgi:hypothetical protein
MDTTRITTNINGQQHTIVPDRTTSVHKFKIAENRSYGERIYNLGYKVLFSLEPDKVKSAEILYSPEFVAALKNPDKHQKNVLGLLKQHLTIESYVIDRERSRDFSIKELEDTIDYLIDRNEQRIANQERPDFPLGVEYKDPNEPPEWPPAHKGCKESLLTNYIYHLYSRVAFYSQSIPAFTQYEYGNCYCFFNNHDNLVICNLPEYQKKYDRGSKSDHKITMDTLYSLRRLIQKDKILRDQDSNCILHNLTYHPGFEHRHNIRKLKMSLALISSIGLTGLAFYKGYLKQFSAH